MAQKGSPREVGIAHIAVLVILGLGLVAGVYLVQHPQIFKPEAYERLGGGPISGPIVCKQGINSFAVESECRLSIDEQPTFEGVSFQCHDWSEFVSGNVGIGTTVNVGIGTSMNIGIVTSGNVGIGTTVVSGLSGCRTSPEWSNLAKEVCGTRSNCPVPSPTPRIYSTPEYATPQYFTPSYGTPIYGTPSYGTPIYSSPP
ncbi:MAG: hypothetical protein G01um10147_1100 [Microgenomates group bacterium Gr01-1014_7]|nr:MAG: hypothetical protein G01um10147_1100 [Microgenomates group bacterium Gr01-1014_7]